MNTTKIKDTAHKLPAIFFMLAAIVMFISGCNKNRDDKLENLGRANAVAPSNLETQPVVAQSTEPRQKKVVTGEITELIDVENYTYIKFKIADGLQKWAAVFKGKFEVGQQVAISESIEMQNFHSPTLNRTFDKIIFGSVVAPDNKPITPETDQVEANPHNLPPGHPPID